MADRGAWRGRRALVTGAGGFVGSWLAAALVEAGADVTVVLRDRAASNALGLHGVDDRVNTVYGSISDHDLMERALNEHEVDSVFHLAAQAIVGAANRAPASTFDSNIRGTWTLLEACRMRSGVERVVVASSDKAYGAQPVLPYTEDMALLALNPYDASKACTDILARTYHASFGLPVAVTRMANIYGGADLNLSRLVPGTILAALAGERPVIRSDGTPLRDYLYRRGRRGGIPGTVQRGAASRRRGSRVQLRHRHSNPCTRAGPGPAGGVRQVRPGARRPWRGPACRRD